MLDHYLALDFEGRMRFMTTNWKLMDSAPRDGSEIVIFDRGLLVSLFGFWELDAWRTCDSNYDERDRIIDDPLCWMEPPKPPTKDFLKTLENPRIKSNST